MEGNAGQIMKTFSFSAVGALKKNAHIEGGRQRGTERENLMDNNTFDGEHQGNLNTVRHIVSLNPADAIDPEDHSDASPAGDKVAGTPVSGGAEEFYVLPFLIQHGVGIKEIRGSEENEPYVIYVLGACVFDSAHTDSGREVHITRCKRSGKLSYHCDHPACSGRTWWDVRKELTGDDRLTAAALQEMTFPEPGWIVPGIIPEGSTLYAGKPKTGKSYMALDIALAVATGGKALGWEYTAKRDVLYLSLEDGERRLQKRIAALRECGGWPDNLYFCTDWPRLDKGGDSRLKKFLEDNPEVKLLIIDTFAKIKPIKGSGKAQYDQDYRAADAIKSLAHKMDISLIAIHHARKMPSEDDPFDAISGTTGLTGVFDTCMVLQKERTGGATLYVRGRDVEETELALHREPSGGWTVLGDAASIAKTEERNAILGAMESGRVHTLKELADITLKKESNLNKLLSRLMDEGKVEKAGYGKYRKLS
jgi:hypothetical protein